MGVRTGFKQTDAGVIPEAWHSVKVGDVCDCIVPGRNKPRLFNGKIPWVTTPDLNSSTTVTTSRLGLCISPEEARSVGSKIVPPGSVLMSCAGELGIVAMTKNEIVVNQQLHVFIPTDRIEAAFLLNALAYRKDQIESYGTKTAVPYLNKSACNSIPVPLPPIPEQLAIATALSDVDALIAGLERLIAKKRDIKQAAMQQLLTGQTRLPGFSGEWECRRFGDFVQFLKSGVNSRAELAQDGDVKYLHYGDIHGALGVFLDVAQTAMPCLPQAKASALNRLRDGDLVFADASEDMDGIGKAVELRVAAGQEVVSGLHTIAARFDKQVLADGFKAYLQFMPQFSRHLKRLAAGTKVFATHRGHVASAELNLPGVEEQTAIANVLSTMDIELSALEARLTKTRAIKQGMMQELLTGRTRLI